MFYDGRTKDAFIIFTVLIHRRCIRTNERTGERALSVFCFCICVSIYGVFNLMLDVNGVEIVFSNTHFDFNLLLDSM